MVVDDSDKNPVLLPINQNLTKIDLGEHKGIHAATRAGVEVCTGDFIIYLDHDDYILPSLMRELSAYLEKNPNKEFIYTDEQLVSSNFQNLFVIKNKPFFIGKLRTHMFIGHTRCCKTSLAKEIEEERKDEDYAASQDYDFALRVWEHVGDKGVGYLKKVLYKWRRHGGGHQLDIGKQAVADEFAKQAINDHFIRCGEDAKTTNRTFGRYNVSYKPKSQSLEDTCIIFPTRDKPKQLVHFLNSLENQIDANNIYPVFHHFGSDGNEDVMATKEILKSRFAKNIVGFNETFNYSRMINAGLGAVGDSYKYIILANDDLIMHHSAIKNMVGFADSKPTAGIVGAKLMFPRLKDNNDAHFDCWTLDTYACQHGGVVYGGDGLPGHYWHERASNDVEVNFERPMVAVTFAFALIRTEIFEKVSFDQDFPSNYQDVIFCNDANKLGWEVWYCPWSKGFHHEGLSRKPLGLCDTTKDQPKFIKRIEYGK